MKKILSLLLTLAMVLSWLPSAALATKNTEFPPGPDTASLEEQMQRALFSADLRQYSEDCEEPERYDPDETIRVIVEMKAAPAYEVASTASTDALKSAETAALKGQEATIQAVRKQLGLEPVHRTACLVNMVTYDIRRGDVKKLEELPGVVSVTEAVQYEVEMYTSKDMANVLEAWGMGETGYTGKGMTIAIIDTGVNYLHKDMVQNPDTMKHTQAQMQEMIDDLGHGKWYSDKVPFGYSYISGNDNILNPDRIHGYHVAGISAANGDEEDGGIAGVAPDAQIFAASRQWCAQWRRSASAAPFSGCPGRTWQRRSVQCPWWNSPSLKLIFCSKKWIREPYPCRRTPVHSVHSPRPHTRGCRRPCCYPPFES